MCGRYRESRNAKLLAQHFETGEPEFEFSARYNIAPTQSVPIVQHQDGARALALSRWGLIPFWAKDAKIGYRMINARSETILEKPAFRDAFKKRRCLIAADGFYEWKKLDSKTKQPHHFGIKDGGLFAFAGIWDTWKSPEGKPVVSCSILTTAPNQLLREVHDRMPVILSARNYELWLTAEPERVNRLADLLLPYPAQEMDGYPVSTLINSPKNDTPECAQKAAASATGA